MRLEEEIKQTAFADEYQKLAVNLIYTQSHFATLLDRALQEYGISPEQFNVLRILRGQHPRPMAVKDIQERMLNRMSNTSRLVEKLRHKGLVERVACRHDRRAVDISLTPEGLRRLEVLNQVVADLHQRYRTLSEEEARRLNRLLDKLRGNKS